MKKDNSIHYRNHNEIWKQDKMLMTQQEALDELKKESVSLYESAIQFDPNIMPITFKGPVATPPIKDYIQDGDYKETTQSFKVNSLFYIIKINVYGFGKEIIRLILLPNIPNPKSSEYP